MDINNYSYSVMGDSEKVLAAYSGDYAAPVVALSRVIDWSGSFYYYVLDIISGACGEFPFLNDPVEDRAAYEKAARLYNSLVPDSAAVPLF